MEIIFLIGRILLGGYFLYNGYNHFKHKKDLIEYAKLRKIPFPDFSIIGTGVVLAFGGISILTGLLVLPGLWLLVGFLVLVSFTTHAFWAIPKGTAIRQSEEINFTKNMALAGALLMIIAMVMY